MRLAVAILLIAFAGSCTEGQELPRVDRIEMRQTGWLPVDVQINGRGEGHYQMSLYPRERKGSFAISPRQFVRLAERLKPFQRKAEPMNDESIRRIFDFRCPESVPDVTDHGGFWIRWIGPGYDRHHSADFGCDYKRNRVRNDELQSVLRSLPLPNQL